MIFASHLRLYHRQILFAASGVAGLGLILMAKETFIKEDSLGLKVIQYLVPAFIGKLIVHSVLRKLKANNPGLIIHAFAELLGLNHTFSLISEYYLVIGGLTNLPKVEYVSLKKESIHG
jgi:hypothetical protein